MSDQSKDVRNRITDLQRRLDRLSCNDCGACSRAIERAEAERDELAAKLARVVAALPGPDDDGCHHGDCEEFLADRIREAIEGKS